MTTTLNPDSFGDGGGLPLASGLTGCGVFPIVSQDREHWEHENQIGDGYGFGDRKGDGDIPPIEDGDPVGDTFRVNPDPFELLQHIL